MSKRISLAAAAGVATLVMLPSASEAHCLRHWGDKTVSTLDCSKRTMRHIGDGVVRAGDRMFGWIFCKGRRS